MAFGAAAGVLVDIFQTRALFVPAMVIVLGRWNWWLSPLFAPEGSNGKLMRPLHNDGSVARSWRG